MPHATNDMSPSNLTNGEKPQPSKFLSHATSYPVVNDSIEAVKAHPYGKKALELADGAYQQFGKPVEPYLETPYSYVKPYVARADELADSGLQKVDGRFPIVKEDTSTVIDTGKSYVFWPYHYVYGTYSDEYRKTANQSPSGSGLAVLIKSLISTELKIASDFFQTVADILGPRYEDSKKKSADYVRRGQDAAEHYRQVGVSLVDEVGSKIDESRAVGAEKAQQGKEQVQQHADQAVGQAKETKEQAKGQAKDTKEQAKGQAQQGREEAKARTGTK